MAALETKTMKLGLNVTNPGTREPTVTASAFATLQAISGGRMVIGIGRGDSARRTIGLKPVKVDEFERSTAMIKELTNGRPVRWNDFDVHIEWAPGSPRSPCTSRATDRGCLPLRAALPTASSSSWPTRRSSSGSSARCARRPRRPGAIRPRSRLWRARRRMCPTTSPTHEQVRWFPAMVSNHVFDLLAKHDKATLPAALTDYVERMQREEYDYPEHSVGAEHGQQVSDETCERFCVLGTPEQASSCGASRPRASISGTSTS